MSKKTKTRVLAQPRSLKHTTRRTRTKRGVLWLGQTCNQRCYFCYFIDRIMDHQHPEHAFMELEKAKQICTTLREVYGNTAIDIQGGEPTIYKDIFTLIEYCNHIGLYPTLITNALMLGKEGVLEQYRAAGLRDFLVSLHGVGDVHDEVVCVKGAYEKITKALQRMKDLDFPFRINCTMSKPVIPVLTRVAQHAIDYGALAVNFIAFNPFGDQQAGHRSAVTVSRYSELKGELAKAIDLLEAAGIETNVRYLPLCMGEARHRKNFYNFQQLSYDHHEWDFQSWTWTMMQPQMMREGDLVPPFFLGPNNRYLLGRRTAPDGEPTNDPEPAPSVNLRTTARRLLPRKAKFFLQRQWARLIQLQRGKEAVWRKEARERAEFDCAYAYHDGCAQCTLRHICDGFHGDYAGFFGTEEAEPETRGAVIEDPTHFIREQEKLVEPEDEGWAMVNGQLTMV